MKRYILIFLLCLPIFILADECSETYKIGVDLFKAGEYTEAQRKFIAVAKVCGNYSNVYQYLKDCNTKLSEKLKQIEASQKTLSSQISSLKVEKEQLSKAKTKSETEWNNERAKLVGKVKGYENTIEQRNQTISNLERQLEEKNQSMELLREEIRKASNDAAELVKIAQRVIEQDSIINSNSETIDGLTGEINQNNESISNLQDELNRMSIELESANRKINTLREARESYCRKKKIKFKTTKEYCNCTD